MSRSTGRSAPALAIRLAAILLAAALVAGCGKKSAPAPPAGEPVTYPQAYPHD